MLLPCTHRMKTLTSNVRYGLSPFCAVFYQATSANNVLKNSMNYSGIAYIPLTRLGGMYGRYVYKYVCRNRHSQRRIFVRNSPNREKITITVNFFRKVLKSKRDN